MAKGTVALGRSPCRSGSGGFRDPLRLFSGRHFGLLQPRGRLAASAIAPEPAEPLCSLQSHLQMLAAGDPGGGCCSSAAAGTRGLVSFSGATAALMTGRSGWGQCWKRLFLRRARPKSPCRGGGCFRGRMCLWHSPMPPDTSPRHPWCVSLQGASLGHHHPAPAAAVGFGVNCKMCTERPFSL